ncbi:RNA pyrophosphohydrolase [Sulfidibacter corallicola]|uniref:RNA pyrophosphohydrolase n=1 Tax=Sulfidibacter corallicola TaxID=2818388 RepID=A0A8A4TV92_SULCO|nr:RNA pyrophosphohydrolase [Sulfidibacter corallicola]QTD53869.1 RNA pyrophosphohydrolase [Sulfidibacter corallicola]
MMKSREYLEFREPRVPDPLESLCPGVGPFRPNAAILILRLHEGRLEILVGERHDTPGAWQWPQGGLDAGETPEQAARREASEEIGVRDIDLLYEYPFGLRYRFPERLGKKFAPRVGQEQHYFIAALFPDDPPDLAKASHEEFAELRWMPLEGAAENAIWFKRPVYECAVAHAMEVAPELDLPQA